MHSSKAAYIAFKICSCSSSCISCELASPLSQMILLLLKKVISKILWSWAQIIVLFRFKDDLMGDVLWSMALFLFVCPCLYFDPITCDVFRIKREREGQVKYSGFLHTINCFLSGKCKSTWHEQIDGVGLAGCTFIWGLGKKLRVDIDGEGF